MGGGTEPGNFCEHKLRGSYRPRTKKALKEPYCNQELTKDAEDSCQLKHACPTHHNAGVPKNMPIAEFYEACAQIRVKFPSLVEQYEPYRDRLLPLVFAVDGNGIAIEL